MLDLLLGFLLPIPETATTYTYAGYRWGPADAPIRMDACEASAEVFRGISRSSVINYGTGFTLQGHEAAKEVRLRFTFTDDTWQPLETEEETLTGIFTPGAHILRTHRYGGDFSKHGVIHHAAAILCSPLSVLFNNGTRWTWNPPATPWPAHTASPLKPLSSSNLPSLPLSTRPTPSPSTRVTPTSALTAPVLPASARTAPPLLHQPSPASSKAVPKATNHVVRTVDFD